MTNRKARIGLVGCGFISEIYLKNLTQVLTDTEVVACSDLIIARARNRAQQFGIPRVCNTNEELYAMPEVDIVLNLTTPDAHTLICRQALEAGKHAYTEKPFSLTLGEGQELVRLAAAKNLLIACAPDTILGSGIQTARQVLDQGWIGRPFAAMCHMLRAGPESWHPDPAFLYRVGAGPIYDSAPYFVGALHYLLGSVERVYCGGRVTYAERTITSEPLFGTRIPVEVPTFIAAQLEFANQALATLVVSVDVPHSRQQDRRQHDHAIEIFGTEGTLSVPSPCFYEGAIYYRRNDMAEWAELPGLFPYTRDSRGVGVADFAAAVLNGREPRLNGEMALHTLDILTGFDRSQQQRVVVPMTSTLSHRTAPLSIGLHLGDVDVPVGADHVAYARAG
jgi:predicted dehydrogenase